MNNEWNGIDGRDGKDASRGALEQLIDFVDKLNGLESKGKFEKPRYRVEFNYRNVSYDGSTYCPEYEVYVIDAEGIIFKEVFRDSEMRNKIIVLNDMAERIFIGILRAGMHHLSNRIHKTPETETSETETSEIRTKGGFKLNKNEDNI